MTFEYEGYPGHVSRATQTLQERDGRTTLTSSQLFDTQGERDGMMEGGAKAGYDEGLERLAALLRAAAKLV